MDFLALSALHEYFPHPAAATDSPRTSVSDPATARNDVLMHPLKFLRRADGYAATRGKPQSIKMDPSCTNQSIRGFGAGREGLPGPEPGQYSEPKNGPSTFTEPTAAEFRGPD